jgi:tetratricopeptide (TPR) repeat protein
MLVMLYFFIIGIKQTLKWLRKIIGNYRANAAVASLMFILLIPNLSWVQNYVLNCWQYGHSSENSYCDPKNPEMFTNPLHLAAKWIARHTDSSAIVFSYWKELAIWLDGRKVIVGRSLIPPDQFDYQLRDYGVKYVVAVHWQATLNECEPLFAKSKKFEFVLVHRVGNVQIFEVRRKGEQYGKSENIIPVYQKAMPTGQSDIDLSYNKALHLLEDDPAKAEPVFLDLASQVKNSTVMEYYLGVTKEFLGQIDSANMIFEKYSSYMQAGIFARMAWQHQEIISQLKNASYNNNPYERVMIFHMLAKDYWNLGFRKQAIKMLDRALEIDSTYRPVIESYAVYAFLQGDTVSAENYLKKCQKIESYNIFASNFISTVQYIHALQNTANPAKQRELRLKIAKSYITIGLLENAIDELQALLYSNRSDITAIRLLGELYEIKNLYEPALRCYKTLLILDPMDREAERKISILSARF